MRRKLSMAAVCLLVLSFFHTATAEDRPPKSYAGPVAERPTLFPEESWTFRQPDGYRKWVFVGFEEDLLKFQRVPYGKGAPAKNSNQIAFWSQDLNFVRMVDGDTGEVVSRNPAGQNGPLKFPLWLGKQWEFSHSESRSSDGNPRGIDESYKVAGYEKITVEAGTFDTFRIELEWRRRGARKRWQGTFWYAPLPKGMVKWTNVDVDGFMPGELVQYSVKELPPAEAIPDKK